MGPISLSAKPKKPHTTSRYPKRVQASAGPMFGRTQAPTGFGYSPVVDPGVSMSHPALQIGDSNDPEEIQADAVANRVMQTSPHDASGAPARSLPEPKGRADASTLDEGMTLTPLSSM